MIHCTYQCIPSSDIPSKFTDGESFKSCTVTACHGLSAISPTLDAAFIDIWPISDTFPKSFSQSLLSQRLPVPTVVAGWIITMNKF